MFLALQLNVHKTRTLGGDWNIEFVRVTRKGASQSFYFPYDAKKDLEPGNVYTLEQQKVSKVAPMKKYVIEVKTSDKMFSGTDNKVSINVVGTSRSSGMRELNNDFDFDDFKRDIKNKKFNFSNDFEAGQTNSFVLEMGALG